jgi:hypothetical protein
MAEYRSTALRQAPAGNLITPGWALVGLALVGLGIWGFLHFEPDLRRYLKIRSM